MELDATRKDTLNEKEKARRQKEKLCFYCAKPGHQANQCQAKKADKDHGKLRATSKGNGEETETVHYLQATTNIKKTDEELQQQFKEMFEVNIGNAYLNIPTCQKGLDNKCWRICEQKCKELRQEPCDEWGIQPSECNYHYDLKMEEVKDPKHNEHTCYPTYGCSCELHEKQQKEFKQWTRVMKGFMYHGDYGCDLKDCQHCGNDMEDDDREQEMPVPHEVLSTEHPDHNYIHWSFCYKNDCLTHKEGKDNESKPMPSKQLWATTSKNSKDKEPEWEILGFEEHKQEVLRILSLMESMTQKETCPTKRAMWMEADDMH
ncbi:hypothetical protein LOZ66_006945 [Ophidiomyces ophidiicola]|nr:hypothetical protein LOZ66_006945 [Ophidiomyces ophidiicola]